MTATRPVETVAESSAQPEAGRKFGPLLPDRMRRRGRPHLLVELVFTVGLYLAYSRTRRYVPSHRTAAMHRAREILHTERLLHIDLELTLNHAVDKVSWLVVSMNYYYASLHFLVTPLVLIWLYTFRPAQYRAGRTALYTATLLALFGFAFFALAPPRFLSDQGFIDTVVEHHTWGSIGSEAVSTVSNQYAAMPSVHIVWAAWSGITVAFLARHTWIRVLGALYPVATFVVILSTGNHFIADAAGGALTLALGFLIQRVLSGKPAYRAPGDRWSKPPVALSGPVLRPEAGPRTEAGPGA
ncbi:phosphatase PAP2 family protein [Streptomyces polygonati]|uniref:Phosphatase PAP2 family protein n=1 Tax=Streptomyces polygonati TaxID=1617087 RepID=A0ABV8HK86_9ACTN